MVDDVRGLDRFQETLNRHGHPFQYAVLQRARSLADSEASDWMFQVSEFPVATRGGETRIDFVLSRGAHWVEDVAITHYLVAECKRVNPAFSDWLFARAPIVRRNETSSPIVFEQVLRLDRELFATAVEMMPRANVSRVSYHVGHEVKGAAKGDPCGSARGAIEEAAGQVIKGVNGLVDFLSRNRSLVSEGEHRGITIWPVIFTTARLWVSEVDLSTTDISSGVVSLEGDVAPKQADWLWYQYHQSPGLRHQVPRHEGRSRDLGGFLNLDYARSVAIVNASGVDEFLTLTSHWDSPNAYRRVS